MTAKSAEVVATFPPGFFLENIAVLPDDTLLVSVANRQSLYCLPPPATPGQPRSPFLLQQFPPDQWAMGLASSFSNPNLVYSMTCHLPGETEGRNHLHVFDASNVALGSRVATIAEFPPQSKFLNGLCPLSENVLLAADSFAGCIWRLDIAMGEDGSPKSAKITEWLRDPSMDATFQLPDFQPGTNGLKYSQKAGLVVFSSTQQQIFARVKVHPETLSPDGPVEVLATGIQGDDLIIDDDFEGGPVGYLTTHRDNSILRIPLTTAKSPVADKTICTVSQATIQHPLVAGPTAGVFKVGEKGKTAYFTYDGGLKHRLEDGVLRSAGVVKIEL